MKLSIQSNYYKEKKKNTFNAVPSIILLQNKGIFMGASNQRSILKHVKAPGTDKPPDGEPKPYLPKLY